MLQDPLAGKLPRDLKINGAIASSHVLSFAERSNILNISYFIVQRDTYKSPFPFSPYDLSQLCIFLTKFQRFVRESIFFYKRRILHPCGHSGHREKQGEQNSVRTNLRSQPVILTKYSNSTSPYPEISLRSSKNCFSSAHNLILAKVEQSGGKCLRAFPFSSQLRQCQV